MKFIVPAIIIGLVGGMLDEFTELHKIWCFLIGLVVFYLYVFIKSIFTTARIKNTNKHQKNDRIRTL